MSSSVTESRMITLTVSGPLFEFHSFTSWRDRAARFYRNCGVRPHKTIAVDTNGRVCATGMEFMRADKEGTFPVKVYEI